MNGPLATTEDMITAFSEPMVVLLSNVNSPGAETLNTSVVQGALARASARAWGFLGNIPPEQLSPVPESVRWAVCDMARYFLDQVDPAEVVTKNYEKALQFLGNVAKGIEKLGYSAVTSQATPATDIADFTPVEPTFSPTALGGFQWP